MKNNKLTVMAIIIVAIVGIVILKTVIIPPKGDKGSIVTHSNKISTNTPQLLELGSITCVPCKMMAPILDELRKEYSGKLQVRFIDVRKNPEAARQYAISIIPTQVFLDVSGKELFRHEGFFAKQDILSKWTELGYRFEMQLKSHAGTIERFVPAKQDTRRKDMVCGMCEKDIDPGSRVTVDGMNLCSMHCFFILFSCYTGDSNALENKALVTARDSGAIVPIKKAWYVYSFEEKTSRPVISAFKDKNTALNYTRSNGGSVIGYDILRKKELAVRCGFCDRAVYPEDAALVNAGGIYTYGCCSHCAMGVAARTGLDIEVMQPDGLTGEMITVQILNGTVKSIKPGTSVAWFGQRQKPDGTWASAGCFHQGFFRTENNLNKWLDAHPYETGKMISINRALEDKMKLTPQQIQKACKIGECSPK